VGQEGREAPWGPQVPWDQAVQEGREVPSTKSQGHPDQRIQAGLEDRADQVDRRVRVDRVVPLAQD